MSGRKLQIAAVMVALLAINILSVGRLAAKDAPQIEKWMREDAVDAALLVAL